MWVLFPARQFSTGFEKSSFFGVLEQILQKSCALQEIDLPLIVLKGRLYCAGVEAGAGRQVVEDITRE